VNMTQKISIGVTSIVALAVFALPMGGSQATPTHTAAVASSNLQAVNSQETDPALQWDMEYGDHLPPSSAQLAAR